MAKHKIILAPTARNYTARTVFSLLRQHFSSVQLLANEELSHQSCFYQSFVYLSNLIHQCRGNFRGNNLRSIAYRLHPDKLGCVKSQIYSLLADGNIEQGVSSWAGPSLLSLNLMTHVDWAWTSDGLTLTPPINAKLAAGSGFRRDKG